MKQINIGIIGTGWCGGIRAEACSTSPWVKELHIAEIKEDRLKEVAAKTKPVTATSGLSRTARRQEYRCDHRFRHARDHALPHGQGKPAGGQASCFSKSPSPWNCGKRTT